ncbi:MAG: low-specificity L-threonine aldolase [Verrucomicrobiota bacterium]
MKNQTDGVVDLRSDTLTLPTSAMRRAMAKAPVGDDVWGEDPTIRQLEARTAELLGKPAALYVPSGTMANQIAIRTHTRPGDEVIVEANAHIYYYEAGGPAVLSGVQCRCIEGRRGIFGPDDLREVLRPANIHFPTTRLVCLEHTHNRGGGSLWPLPTLRAVAATARQHDLKLHLDGARLWNASVATGIPEKEYARHVDSLSVCFSKGLGAPVGSALAGPVEFIERARRWRKVFGGGMRQAGIIAAGALYAVEHHRERLARDHAHAQMLAAALAELPGVELDVKSVETNMVVFQTVSQPAADLVQKMDALGIRMLAVGPKSIRLVTHLMISRADIRRAIAAFRQVCAKS